MMWSTALVCVALCYTAYAIIAKFLWFTHKEELMRIEKAAKVSATRVAGYDDVGNLVRE